MTDLKRGSEFRWTRGADGSGLAQVTLLMPLLAPVAFIFDQKLASVFAGLGFEGTLLPNVTFVKAQYDALQNCSWLKSVFDNLPCKSYMSQNLKLFDFQLFESLIVIFLTIGLARVTIDIFRLEKLDGYAKIIPKDGLTTILVAFFVLGPVATVILTDVRVASAASLGSYLIMHSPRAFLCLSATLFGIAVAFMAAGLVFVFWLLFRRPFIASNSLG